MANSHAEVVERLVLKQRREALEHDLIMCKSANPMYTIYLDRVNGVDIETIKPGVYTAELTAEDMEPSETPVELSSYTKTIKSYERYDGRDPNQAMMQRDKTEEIVIGYDFGLEPPTKEEKLFAALTRQPDNPSDMKTIFPLWSR